MYVIVFARPVDQVEMSWSKRFAFAKTPVKSVTEETSQSLSGWLKLTARLKQLRTYLLKGRSEAKREQW